MSTGDIDAAAAIQPREALIMLIYDTLMIAHTPLYAYSEDTRRDILSVAHTLRMPIRQQAALRRTRQSDMQYALMLLPSRAGRASALIYC